MSQSNKLPERQAVITVGGAGCDIQGFTSWDIRSAVEEIRRSGGGTVLLDAGVFHITGPVRLYSGITLQGKGTETVLRKSAGFTTRLTADADYGDKRVEVEDPSGFEPGMGVQVYDESQKWGWDESTAMISRIEGKSLFIDRYLERDYDKDDGGTLTNGCSIIEAAEAGEVRISDLLIDGSKSSNHPIGGCRGGGIYFYKVKNSRIERVEVKDFNGDGISWQITEDITVAGCRVTGCSGSGYHPGAGSARTIIKDCVAEGNGLAGLFVCWRVQHGTFTGNRFCRNGSYGISIGHRDSDNLFEGNEISGNGVNGICFRPEKEGNGADRNRWYRNTIEDNGSSGSGVGVYVNGVAADNEFRNNRIGDTGSNRQQSAVWLGDGVAGFDFG